MAKSERFADLGAGARFFVVSLGGVIVDIAIGWALVELFGLPLWLGATFGFAVAAAGNYAAHELWTFRAAGAGLSARRALQYVGASALILMVRLAVVTALGALTEGAWTLAILVAGAGVSFFVNFAVSKLLIFARRPEPKEP